MRVILSFLLCMAVVNDRSALAASPDSSVSAYETVKSVTDELLARLIVVQPLYESDQEKYFQEIDLSLAPFVDFGGFSRGVMAKYYRRASDEQKSQFVVTFRTALIRTYSKALAEFDNEQIIVLEDDKPQKDPNKARVSLEVHAKDGAIYLIEYSLVWMDEKWKLRNIVIEGINIGLQFRSQFSASMQEHKNDMDSVIQNWNVDV
jgi:phospholipid transport system substrate-binding protein